MHRLARALIAQSLFGGASPPTHIQDCCTQNTRDPCGTACDAGTPHPDGFSLRQQGPPAHPMEEEADSSVMQGYAEDAEYEDDGSLFEQICSLRPEDTDMAGTQDGWEAVNTPG